MKIVWDLEATPLQIKTDSATGSNAQINLEMFKGDGGLISDLKVKFSDKIQYHIGVCTNSLTDLPVQPPVDVDMLWTIIKTDTSFIITCNDVEVVKYLMKDAGDNRCEQFWGGDVVEKIEFKDGDTASESYGSISKYINFRNRPDQANNLDQNSLFRSRN